jgi:hypothetical protein
LYHADRVDPVPENMYYGFIEVLAAIHPWQQLYGEPHQEEKNRKYAIIAYDANTCGKEAKYDLIFMGLIQLTSSSTSEEYLVYGDVNSCNPLMDYVVSLYFNA